MTPTSRPGILHQTINENVDVIINTNNNQLIKRKNGRAKIFYYENEDEVEFIINLIELTEDLKLTLN